MTYIGQQHQAMKETKIFLHCWLSCWCMHSHAKQWLGLQENHGIKITVNTMIMGMCRDFGHCCDYRQIMYKISTVELLWCQLMAAFNARLRIRIVHNVTHSDPIQIGLSWLSFILLLLMCNCPFTVLQKFSMQLLWFCRFIIVIFLQSQDTRNSFIHLRRQHLPEDTGLNIF